MKSFRLSHRPLVAILAGLVAALGIPSAAAQTWPAKSIRMVVGVPVGSPPDVISRLIAESMSSSLGQNVVVENKPGAMGIVSAQDVLRQPPDGHTLMSVFMPMTVGQTIFKNVPFDLRRDFVPVAQTAWSYNVLAVHPSVNAVDADRKLTIKR